MPRAAGAFALLLLALALHAPALSTPLQVDDQLLDLHPAIADRDGARAVWTDSWLGPLRPAGERRHYRPLATLTLRWTHRPGELWFARLINLALLAACGALLAAWLRPHTGPAPAWLAAALVVGHPAHHALALQIVTRADLQCWLGVLLLTTLVADAARHGRWRPARLLAAIAAGALALGSKEQGVLVIPAALAAVLVTRPAAPASPTTGDEVPPRPRRVLTPLLPALFAALALLLAGRRAALGSWLPVPGSPERGAHANPLEGLCFLDRLPGAGDVATTYLGLLLWPDPSLFHHPDAAPSWTAAWTASAALGLALYAALAVALLRALRARHPIALPTGLALGHLLLVGNLVVPIGVYAANRHVLPLALAAAAALALAIARGPRLLIPATLATALFVLACVPTTWRTELAWRDRATMMDPDLRHHPDRAASLAWAGHGLRQRDPERAAAMLERALTLRPDDPTTRLRLGELRYRLGDLAAAEQALRPLADEPSDDPIAAPQRQSALVGLARVALARGATDSAQRLLGQATAIDPTADGPLVARIALAGRTGDERALEAALLELLRHHPDHPVARQTRRALIDALRQRAASTSDPATRDALRARLERLE